MRTTTAECMHTLPLYLPHRSFSSQKGPFALRHKLRIPKLRLHDAISDWSVSSAIHHADVSPRGTHYSPVYTS